jgi:hypothetical protein
MDALHPSHVTRITFDSSVHDEICINCHAADDATGGWGNLAKPCPNPPGKGGMTKEEFYEKERKDRAKQSAT